MGMKLQTVNASKASIVSKRKKIHVACSEWLANLDQTNGCDIKQCP